MVYLLKTVKVSIGTGFRPEMAFAPCGFPDKD